LTADHQGNILSHVAAEEKYVEILEELWEKLKRKNKIGVKRYTV